MLFDTITALIGIGVTFVGWSIVGESFLCHLSCMPQLLILAGGLFLLIPHLTLDLLGSVIGAMGLVWEHLL